MGSKHVSLVMLAGVAAIFVLCMTGVTADNCLGKDECLILGEASQASGKTCMENCTEQCSKKSAETCLNVCKADCTKK